MIIGKEQNCLSSLPFINPWIWGHQNNDQTYLVRFCLHLQLEMLALQGMMLSLLQWVESQVQECFHSLENMGDRQPETLSQVLRAQGRK